MKRKRKMSFIIRGSDIAADDYRHCLNDGVILWNRFYFEHADEDHVVSTLCVYRTSHWSRDLRVNGVGVGLLSIKRG